MFESYAQNAEDVLLRRCFPVPSMGRYLDVGASEPTRHSATYAQYLAGWCGISIDPLAERVAELNALRPRDINLCCAAGRIAGEATLFRSTARGGTSTIVAARGQKMAAANNAVRELIVPVRTLAEICAAYWPGVSNYEFLKIDAEGAEAEILGGADFTACAPALVCIEDGDSSECADILSAEGYLQAADDGVNRWFVRAHDRGLFDSLRKPVNVHDDFRRVDQYRSPYVNRAHPDHAFSVALGQAALQSLTELDDEALCRMFLSRMTAERNDLPAGNHEIVRAYRVVFGRKPTSNEVAHGVGHTVRGLVTEMVKSNEFRMRRGRAIASL